jgi:predicted nucleotidyltransferase
MRLSLRQQDAIRKTIYALDPDAKIVLFGSRADPDRKGGDIDLLVLSDVLTFEHLWPIRRDILDQIGWQKLDIVLDSNAEPCKPITRIAKLEGVRL